MKKIEWAECDVIPLIMRWCLQRWSQRLMLATVVVSITATTQPTCWSVLKSHRRISWSRASCGFIVDYNGGTATILGAEIALNLTHTNYDSLSFIVHSCSPDADKFYGVVVVVDRSSLLTTVNITSLRGSSRPHQERYREPYRVSSRVCCSSKLSVMYGRKPAATNLQCTGVPVIQQNYMYSVKAWVQVMRNERIKNVSRCRRRPVIGAFMSAWPRLLQLTFTVCSTSLLWIGHLWNENERL